MGQGIRTPPGKSQVNVSIEISNWITPHGKKMVPWKMLQPTGIFGKLKIPLE